MHLTPDEIIFWQLGFIKLNATIVFTWGLMLLLAAGSLLITHRLSTVLNPSRWQMLLEIIVTGIEQQIKEVGLGQPKKYLGFLGTLFLFVAVANLCTLIPGYEPPTGSAVAAEDSALPPALATSLGRARRRAAPRCPSGPSTCVLPHAGHPLRRWLRAAVGLPGPRVPSTVGRRTSRTIT